jgi:hypothetical protein
MVFGAALGLPGNAPQRTEKPEVDGSMPSLTTTEILCPGGICRVEEPAAATRGAS